MWWAGEAGGWIPFLPFLRFCETDIHKNIPDAKQRFRYEVTG
jgi:hypothetical protein